MCIPLQSAVKTMRRNFFVSQKTCGEKFKFLHYLQTKNNINVEKTELLTNCVPLNKLQAEQ